MSMTLVEVKTSLVETSAALISQAMRNRTAAMMASTVYIPSDRRHRSGAVSRVCPRRAT